MGETWASVKIYTLDCVMQKRQERKSPRQSAVCVVRKRRKERCGLGLAVKLAMAVRAKDTVRRSQW